MRTLRLAGIAAPLILVLMAPGPVPSSPPDATTTRRGMVNTGTQGFGGLKVFDGGLVGDLKAGSSLMGLPFCSTAPQPGQVLTFDGGVWCGDTPAANATTAALTLYLDPTGSDSNACTSSSVLACSTLAGVLAKVPRIMRHNVTINVAAGAYGAPFVLGPGITVESGATLTITGTMSAATLATGATTGTITSVTAASNAGPPSITDTSQSWTSNNLRGAFVTFTSGALNGQSFPITSNTATSLTFTTNSNTAVAGNTYSIQNPGSTFISSTQATVTGISGAGGVTISNLKIERTSGTTLSLSGLGGVVTLLSVEVRSASGALVITSGAASVRRSFLTGAGGITVSGVFGPSGPAVAASHSYLVGSTGSAFFGGGPNPASSVIGSALEGGSTSNPVLTLSALSSVGSQNVAIWVTCTGGAGSVGIGTLPISESVAPAMVSFTSNGATRISNCTTAVRIDGKASATILAPAIDNCTTGFSVVKGGYLDFVAGTPVFTGVTNELSVDGTVSTFATLNGMADPKVLTSVYGSRIVR